MQKSLMAVAVAGALAAPAMVLAQSSTVQPYGRLVVNYNFVDQGNTKPSIDMLNTHDSRLGFRGEERLGGGLSAWFQCESTADVIHGGDGLCARNSGVGLKGSFGNIFYGNWDTAAKQTHGPVRPFSTSGAFGSAELMWNGSASNVGNGVRAGGAIGAGSTTAAATGFSRRQASAIHYQSPSWGGFRILGTVSTLNESTGLTNASTASKPRLWSLGAQFRTGALYLGAGYERHKNYNPASQGTYTGGDDTLWQLAAAYTFAKSIKVGAAYTNIEYELAGSTNTERRAWALWLDWRISGPHILRATYTRAGDTKGTAGAVGATGNCAGGVTINSGWCANGGAGNTGADLIGIQYAYAFSKRTQLNFGYARIDNESLSRVALQSISRPASAGDNMDAWVLGVAHNF